jgi:hypothetical protein
MTYEPKTKAGEWLLSMGMLVAAKSPDGGIVNWEAIVQDMEEDAARLERERLLAKKCDIWCANCGGHVGTDDFDPEATR